MPAAAATREKPAEAFGHNSHDLTPGESRALYMYHFDKILKQREIVDREKAEEKRLRKLAKVDGLVLADIDYGMRVATIEDPDIIVQELIRRSEIATFFALPVNTQTGMDFEREPALDRAKREGTAAGWRNAPRETAPHASESRAGQAWLKSYDAARKEALEAEATALEKASARRGDGAADEDEAETTRPEFADADAE